MEQTAAAGVMLAGAIHAQMTLNCTTMSAQANAHALSLGYCPKPTGGATPNATAVGNCGDSRIYIWDVTGGYADID